MVLGCCGGEADGSPGSHTLCSCVFSSYLSIIPPTVCPSVSLTVKDFSHSPATPCLCISRLLLCVTILVIDLVHLFLHFVSLVPLSIFGVELGPQTGDREVERGLGTGLEKRSMGGASPVFILWYLTKWERLSPCPWCRPSEGVIILKKPLLPRTAVCGIISSRETPEISGKHGELGVERLLFLVAVVAVTVAWF